ncbi:MAG: sulfite exporter TauE/SafE family protein [Anaerolineae bacterium]
MELSSTNIIAGLLIVFLAGLTHGLTGFGYALASVPLLIIYLPPKVAVPVVLIHSIIVNAIVLIEVWRWVDLRRIWMLMIAGAVGMPLGTWMLIVLDANLLKALMGVVVTLSGIAFLMGFRREVRNERLASVPLGLASGVLGGSTAMSGPPVVLFFANQGMDKRVFRANLVAYFLVFNLATLPAHQVGGLLQREVLIYTALLVPALLAGAVGGMALARRVPERPFRLITLLVVTVAGVVSIASGLRAL